MALRRRLSPGLPFRAYHILLEKAGFVNNNQLPEMKGYGSFPLTRFIGIDNQRPDTSQSRRLDTMEAPKKAASGTIEDGFYNRSRGYSIHGKEESEQCVCIQSL
ncbi:MAG: hypothetical protein ACOY16_11870 [Chloroflexota bacterium]